jgi:nucleotide-binding universal stress UspA family protein
MKTSILVVLNEAPCSKLAVEFLAQCPLNHSEVQVTLLHVFREPTGSEAMMGRKFLRGQKEKVEEEISTARQRLIEAGYPPDNIHALIETQPYPTVADGIIAEVDEGEYNIVVMARKKMSKSEEFVLGDASIKVIRAVEKATVVVVKC